MKLEQLRSFVVLAEERHFSRAAQRLHKSQPSLSQQIRTLEAELGVDLVVHGSRPTELTEAGSRLARDSRGLLAQAGAVVDRARDVSRGNVSHLAMGYADDFRYGFLPALVARFAAENPNVRLRYRLGLTEDLAQAVRDNDLDLAFVTPPLVPDVPGLHEWSLPSLEFRAVLPRGHRLAEEPAILLASLRDEEFVLPARAHWTGFYRQLTRLFDQAGFEPVTVHETDDSAMQCNLVAATGCVGVATAGSVSVRRPDLAFPRLLGSSASVSQVVVQRTDHDSPVAHAFLQMLGTTEEGST